MIARLFFHIALEGNRRIALQIAAKLIVLARQDRIEQDTQDGGDSQAGQGQAVAAKGKGQTANAVEAQSADQNDRRNQQVSGIGKVDLIFYYVARLPRKSCRTAQRKRRR